MSSDTYQFRSYSLEMYPPTLRQEGVTAPMGSSHLHVSAHSQATTGAATDDHNGGRIYRWRWCWGRHWRRGLLLLSGLIEERKTCLILICALPHTWHCGATQLLFWGRWKGMFHKLGRSSTRRKAESSLPTVFRYGASRSKSSPLLRPAWLVETWPRYCIVSQH